MKVEPGKDPDDEVSIAAELAVVKVGLFWSQKSERPTVTLGCGGFPRWGWPNAQESLRRLWSPALAPARVGRRTRVGGGPPMAGVEHSRYSPL